MKSIIAFCFIMILFSSCKSTPKATEEPIVEKPVVLSMGLTLPEGVSIRDTERGKILVVDNKVIFAFAKSNLPKNAPNVLGDTVKTILNENPNVKIVLEAHTSNKGIAYPYNYQLSVRRASVGKKHLSSIGIADERIISKSFGESLPEYPKQQDLRRYEFVIIENDADLEKYNNFFKTVNPKSEMTYDAYNKKQLANKNASTTESTQTNEVIPEDKKQPANKNASTTESTQTNEVVPKK